MVKAVSSPYHSALNYWIFSFYHSNGVKTKTYRQRSGQKTINGTGILSMKTNCFLNDLRNITSVINPLIIASTAKTRSDADDSPVVTVTDKPTTISTAAPITKNSACQCGFCSEIISFSIYRSPINTKDNHLVHMLHQMYYTCRNHDHRHLEFAAYSSRCRDIGMFASLDNCYYLD